MLIIERLNDCLMYTNKYYSKNSASMSKVDRRKSIKQLFYG
jgi:hypothetical protein